MDPRFTANEFFNEINDNLNDETSFLKYFVTEECNEWFETVMSRHWITIRSLERVN